MRSDSPQRRRDHREKRFGFPDVTLLCASLVKTDPRESAEEKLTKD
jgi:hypothetical protein